MKLDQYCVSHGSKSDLAALLNVPSQLIYQWAKGIREVPVIRCTAIEQATNGEVTRKDLRPDDWHLIWPELQQEGV